MKEHAEPKDWLRDMWRLNAPEACKRCGAVGDGRITAVKRSTVLRIGRLEFRVAVLGATYCVACLPDVTDETGRTIVSPGIWQ